MESSRISEIQKKVVKKCLSVHRTESKLCKRKERETRKHIVITNNMKLMSKDYANIVNSMFVSKTLKFTTLYLQIRSHAVVIKHAKDHWAGQTIHQRERDSCFDANGSIKYFSAIQVKGAVREVSKIYMRHADRGAFYYKIKLLMWFKGKRNVPEKH